MSVTRTGDVEITVTPEYLESQSDPAQGAWLFAYRIRICNNGKQTVQLLTRHWIITDGAGDQEEVRGRGVIGEQPSIGPGEVYQYTSYCPLPTPIGSMEGSFHMVDDAGNEFDARIDPFRLCAPNALN